MSSEAPKAIQCPSVPEVHPTAEEWADPLAYLASLRTQGELVGMVKVVVPPGWEPKRVLDPTKIRIKTEYQAVHELFLRDTVTEAKQFWSSFNAFISSTNFVLHRKKPVFNNQEVDLYRLYRVVEKRGGYDVISDKKAWKDVAEALQIEDKGNNAGSTLKQWYLKYLQPFKEYSVTRNETGAGLLTDAVEAEIFGTKTVVGVKREREGVLEEMDGRDMGTVVEGMLELIPKPKAEVAEADGDKDMNGLEGGDRPPGSMEKKKPTPKKKVASDDDEEGSEDDHVSAMVCEACRGGHYEDQIILCDKCDKGWHMFCLKPKMKKVPKGDWICPACESQRRGVDQVNTQEHTLGEFQRRAADFERKWFASKDHASPPSSASKRKKGSAKDRKISDLDREREFWNVVDGGDDLATVICGVDPKVQIDRSKDGDVRGFCSGNGNKKKGLGSSAQKSASYADGKKKGGSKKNIDAQAAGEEAAEDVPKVEAEVGLDAGDNPPMMEAETLTTGVENGSYPIPAHEEDFGEDAYADIPKIGVMAIGTWKNDLTENLAPYCEMMQAPNGQNRKAIDSPTVEFGMTFSSRPWKVEDQLLYSATYLHSGAGKQWYCIPPYAASLYDSTVHKVHSEYMMSMEWTSPLGPNLMVNPTVLMERGVPVFGCRQEAGTLVVCFPNAYSCSLNLGFNISESMLMLLPEWLRVSSQSASLYRNHRVAPRFSTEKMILKAIDGDNIHNLGLETRYWLHREFSRLVEEETMMRYKLWGEGLRQYRRIIDGEDPRKGVGQHRDQQACISCGTPLVYSMVECTCTPKVAACLHHRRHLCRCRADRQRLAWRYSVGELESNVKKLKESLDMTVVADIERREAALADDVQLCVEEAMVAAKTSEELLREHIIEVYSDTKSGGGCKKNGLGTSKLSSKKRRSGVDANGEEVDLATCAVDNDAFATPQVPGPVSALSPSLTLVVECGYVQGPVRPFEHLDLPPEDFKSLGALKGELEACCQKWIRDATATLQQGGNLVYELHGLIDEADEYLWATLSEEMRRQVLELVPKLVAANQYITSVERALNISNRKTMLEDVEKILNRDPMPINNVPGIQDLQAAVDQAKEWIQKHYEPVSDMTCNPPLDSKVFDNVLFEAGKIPVAIHEAKILRERRDSIKRVADAVRFALPKGRETGRRKGSDEPVTLEFIESLHDEAKKAHIMMPEIEYLNETLGRIHEWRRQVEKAMATRLAWKDFEALIEEGKEMPVEMPDIYRLYELRDAVDAWIAGMHDLKRRNHDHKVPLKKLREYLAEGYALPITFPEIQEMAEYIQTFQLEDVAIKCMSTSVSEEEVREIMDAMAKAGVNNSTAVDLLAALKAKLNAAEAWRSRAATFSSRSVSALEDIVREGEATGLKMELLNQMSERLAVIHRWIQRCNRCLAGVAEDPLRMPELHPQRSLIVECSLPLMRSRVRFIDAKEREKFPSNTVISALVSEYHELSLDLPYYTELCALQERAQAWLQEADPVLNQTELCEDQIPLVESLVEKGLKTGVKIAQVDNLESYMNAFLWQKTAEELLESFSAGKADLNGTSALDNVSQPKLCHEALTAFIAAGDVFASCKHTSVAKGLKKVSNVASRWLKEAAAILREEKPKSMSREHAVEFLRSGKSLPVEVDAVIGDVSDLVAEHDKLVEELADVRSMDNDYSYLTERAKALTRNPIESEAKATVVAALKEMEKTWSAPQPGYGTLFATNSTSSALDTMLHMLSTAQSQADRVEMAGGGPLEPADGSPPLQGAQPLCLCQQHSRDVTSLTKCNCCHAWFHMACISFGPKPSRGRKPKKKAPAEQTKTPPELICPVCSSINAEDKEISELILNLSPPNFVFTSKANLEALREKLGGMRMFQELSSKVDAVLQAATAWKARVEKILARLEFSDSSSANSSASLWPTSALLRQLLISSLAVGFDFGELSCNLLKHLRTNRWRAKALELVSNSNEPGQEKPICTPDFLEGVHKFLDEGTTSLNVDKETDFFYAGVAHAIAENESWNKQLQDLMTHSVEPHTSAWHILQSKAETLINMAPKLSWKVSDELISQLKERITVYCLCQRTYDDAPMLSCDSCSNWFHFGCVGRREDPSLEAEIENWNCPICTASAGGVRIEHAKKKGRKRKDSTVANQAAMYQAHMPIAGVAKETLSTIERVLPMLSKGLSEPDLYKSILEMYSGAAFQRAVLGKDVPDEAFQTDSSRALLAKLDQAMGASGALQCDGSHEDHEEPMEIDVQIDCS